MALVKSNSIETTVQNWKRLLSSNSSSKSSGVDAITSATRAPNTLTNTVTSVQDAVTGKVKAIGDSIENYKLLLIVALVVVIMIK